MLLHFSPDVCPSWILTNSLPSASKRKPISILKSTKAPAAPKTPKSTKAPKP